MYLGSYLVNTIIQLQQSSIVPESPLISTLPPPFPSSPSHGRNQKTQPNPHHTPTFSLPIPPKPREENVIGPFRGEIRFFTYSTLIEHDT